jgi:hypothetical protein
MPTSDVLRLAAFGIAGLALAACDPATMAAGSPSRTRVTVAGQAVTIAAPPGFCIDAPSTVVNSEGAFVLMSDCALLGSAGQGRSPVGAALTASVSAGGLGGEGDDEAATLEDLQDFLDTPDGLALIGRSGRSDRVRILARQLHGGVLYVLVEDRGPPPIAGIDRQFWRAFLEVNGRMTVLSVLGFEGAGVGTQEGLNELAALATAIQRANARGTPG